MRNHKLISRQTCQVHCFDIRARFQGKMDPLQTIDTENEVISFEPLLGHDLGVDSGEQQKKRKFKLPDLESGGNRRYNI